MASKSRHVEEGLMIKHVPTGQFLDDEGELGGLGTAEEYESMNGSDDLADLIESYYEGGHYPRGSLMAVKVRTTVEEV